MRTLRIFISSPSDVNIERQVALGVIKRLGLRFQDSVKLKPVLGEREPLLDSGHFQDVLAPATAGIMVAILWSRLGSPLPPIFKGVDERTGLTGSEWEFYYAVKAYQESGNLNILMYRKTTAIIAKLTDEDSTEQELKQKRALLRKSLLSRAEPSLVMG